MSATESKMLVGNVASSILITPVAETTITATKIKTITTARKLSNPDNHNEYVVASVEEKHLRHAMLGNFNHQNELWQAKLDDGSNRNSNSNTSTNTNTTNKHVHHRCGEANKQCKRLRLWRLNEDTNCVNNMQRATQKTMFAKMTSDATNKRISYNNTTCQRSESYINGNYEQRDNNEESSNSPTSRATTTTANALSTSHEVVSSIETLATLTPTGQECMPISAAAAAAAAAAASTSTSTPLPSPKPAAEPLLRDIDVVKIPKIRCGGTNHAAALNPVRNSKTTGSLKISNIAGKTRGGNANRRRRHFAPSQHWNIKSTSSRVKIESEAAKIEASARASVAKSSSKAPSLNFAALTSFILNSTFLALCNATAATALSAVATTLSSDAGADLQSTVDADAWNGIQNATLANRNGSYGAIGDLNVASESGIGGIRFNDSGILLDEEVPEYIFDRTDVRIIFITLYTLVFCCCFFGNLLVILVVTLSRRLRSITNFFLANLALADFCVGLFCVMQNLSIYLIDSWVFGEFLCHMYQFVHSLSYTASIFILVVICVERYFAIVHPIACKQILTPARLKMVILTVWVTSALFSTPKFLFSKTIKNIHTEDGQEEEICVMDRNMYNSKVLDMISFVLLYVIPLLVMTVLYSKIAIALWRSSHGLSHHLVTQHEQQQQAQHQQEQQELDESMSLHNSMYHHQHQHLHQHQHANQHNHSLKQNHHQHHHLNHHHHDHMPQNHHPPSSILQATINHHHNHLQQTQTAQQLPAAALAIGTPEVGVGVGVGVVGVNSGGVVVCGGAISQTGGLLSRKQSSKYDKRGVSITESQVSLDSDRPIVTACRNGSGQSNNGNSSGGGGGSMNSNHKSSFMQHHHHHHHHSSTHPHPHQRTRINRMPHSSNNVLRARRGVVRMLIIFVLTFALCNLPYHARKMWQYWSRSYRGDSNFNALLTPLTFLVTYFNSGINPLLYAFLSRNFRKGMKELLLCTWKKGKGKSSSNSSMHHKRVALQTHSLPTDTTHIGNEQL
ncbi:uncharacterized protein LOC118735937 [Rhagoletis pomonella]|uniref:uncharacterized protein LOC118735937 n=1 Tax=Rhagoletis pomonella TaxID=28610 RepID=UPI0017829A3E|nr:uncharacterized protein LOC118735937 [Rhagoletis pomonella]